MSSSRAMIKFRSSTDTLGPLSGSANYTPGISIPPNQPMFVRVLSAQLSKQIPNIYNYGDWNNTIVWVANDADQPAPTWIKITLPPGVYTLYELTLAIADATGVHSGLDWWTNDIQPGILIEGNTATGLVYFILDNSKTKNQTGRLGLMFEKETLLYYTLGCDVNGPEMDQRDPNDGSAPGYVFKSTSASLAPHLDTQGTVCDVTTSLNPEMSYVNSTNTDVLLSIPLTVAGDNADEYFYPYEGAISPYIQIRNSGALTGLNVVLLTSTGKEMIFIYGNFNLTLELTTRLI